MALTTYGRQQVTNWITGNGGSPPAALWCKLHTGNPGVDAIANAAQETDRQQTTWGSSDTDGISVSLGDMTWLLVAATEIYTHVSLWDAQVGGNPWYYGPTLAPIPVTVGSDFQISAGTASIQHE